MRVHLVYPNFELGRAGGMQEPLGILYLASALRQAGHQVSLSDMTFSDDLGTLDAPLAEAEVLGIGCTSPLFANALEVLQRARALNPDLLTVIGGPHATVSPEDSLQRGFDAATIGESERSAVELLRRLEQGDDWRSTPGLAVLDGDSVRHNPRLDFVADLDQLPFPARDLIDQRGYLRRNGYISVFNVRGCPFKCTFCKPTQDKLFGRKVRKRSPENVAEELAAIHRDYGSHKIFFKDDTLLLCGTEWFDQLTDELERRSLKLEWFCLGRIDQVNRQLLESAQRAGLRAIAFGVESGSQKILDFYQKGTTPEQAREAFSLCHSLGILTHAYIMLGAPCETRDDLDETVRLFREIRPHSYRTSIATPFPGTRLWEYAAANGISRVTSYEELDCMQNLTSGRSPLVLEHLTLHDIQRCAKRIRRAWLYGNTVRCMSDWKSMKAAIQHVSSSVNILLQRL